MMISPEAYYETQVKGRSEAELRALNRELREDMGRLREEIRAGLCPVRPGPQTQLAMYREYREVVRAELTFLKYGIRR